MTFYPDPEHSWNGATLEEPGDTLLRPAQGNPDIPSDELLRPAHNAGSSAPDELLRSAETKP